jgi:hypothetical protein
MVYVTFKRMMTVIASCDEEFADRRWNRNRCEYLREVL